MVHRAHTHQDQPLNATTLAGQRGWAQAEPALVIERGLEVAPAAAPALAVALVLAVEELL
jgi:hypothetical protein